MCGMDRRQPPPSAACDLYAIACHTEFLPSCHGLLGHDGCKAHVDHLEQHPTEVLDVLKVTYEKQ